MTFPAIKQKLVRDMDVLLEFSKTWDVQGHFRLRVRPTKT
jgi:hypothetical protein